MQAVVSDHVSSEPFSGSWLESYKLHLAIERFVSTEKKYNFAFIFTPS
jgi:hypothetical protein